MNNDTMAKKLNENYSIAKAMQDDGIGLQTVCGTPGYVGNIYRTAK
jgi:hypothetical protein